MPRHSKNATARPFTTNHELSQSCFNFTQEERVGAEAHLPFGYCNLSLKAPVEPVVTPDGYIYDRAFIIEYLAETKLSLFAKQEEYDGEQRRKEALEKLGEARRQLQSLEDFDNTEHSALRSMEIKDGSNTLTKSDCRKKNFWMASEAPTCAPTNKENVFDKTTRCPMSNKKLRLRDLYPVEFSLFNVKSQKAGGEIGMYCCEVTQQPITNQQAYYLKPSRKVILESVLNKLVKPEMICPVSNKKLRDSDIIKLQRPGGSFCANNNVIFRSFRSIKSSRQTIMERVGSLGKKGTAQ